MKENENYITVSFSELELDIPLKRATIEKSWCEC